MEDQIICWVLVDKKIGSNNQAIALAEGIGINYKQIKLSYNCLAKLPGVLLPKGFIQVKSPNIEHLLLEDKPDIVISASRKSALISASIRSKNPNIKAIHILKPDISFANFDLLILPQHDKNIKNKYNNILKIIGALNNAKTKIHQNSELLSQKYSNFIKEPYAVVLIGGNTKKFTFTKETAKEFYELLQNRAENNNIKYFITFSRRTPQVLKDALYSLKNHGHEIYDPLLTELNPYPFIISKAKFVISTCDSISMLSEIASIGAPLYIFIPESFNSQKHLTFVYQLADLGIAKILDKTTLFLQEYNYTQLNETRKAAEYVLSSILSVK